MESVHGVDVSWLHKPNREHHHRTHAPSSPGLTRDVHPPTSSHGGLPTTTSAAQDDASAQPTGQNPTPTKPSLAAQSGVATPSPKTPTTTTTETPISKSPSSRPGLLSRNSNADKQAPTTQRSSRRNSWMNSISSKFSSSTVPPTPAAPAQTSRASANGINAGPSQQTARDQLPSPRSSQNRTKEAEELQPYVPQRPRDATSSFFSSLSRRLSSNAQGGAGGKMASGGMCPRRVMNVDPNRERCLVPELDLAKLRRVSFSVDVEIAGGPKYKDDDNGTTKQNKAKDKKIKERAEGEALKHPEAVTDTKEKADDLDTSTDDAIAASGPSSPPLDGTPESEIKEDDDGQPGKPQRTDEEKRERKERKRRKAEESGQLPVELSQDGMIKSAIASQTTTPPVSGTATPKSQDRPTTDPVRIYRRCCQLRETPILKRITEQLMAPNCTLPDDPGVVTELDLTGSRLQLADVVTLSDWLAIVPVRRLLLEDADLIDEGVRLILAALLASKKPEPIKRRNGIHLPSQPIGGMVEKVTLKNNPRIGRDGWKHIALFLYMCRSIKAFDVSMLQFPQTISPPTQDTAIKPPSRMPQTAGRPVDTAELLNKALVERLGGSTLQELTMAECGLNSDQIRKIVDGATMCGAGRLGFAGNHLDDEGFEHVLSYVRSGVCTALDLGSNDLRGKLGRLGAALSSTENCPFWGISLAGCNLDTASLKDLLPALVNLHDFRFIDLSHNRSLFEGDGEASSLQLLRRYIPKLKLLKRLHLRDVGLGVKHAISLAEVLPENPSLAHLTILENPKLSALATNTDESSQEEACALYASLTAAVRVSRSIVCIDIDVPSIEHGEVVKALAKQVVAYSLRNMDRTMTENATGITATLSKPHGVDDARENADLPNVLYHLVGGHGDARLHDTEDAPDGDYIVGGNGIVKALQYFLGEEDVDLRRGSFPVSGATTPMERQEEAGREMKRRGKAKEVSKNLLDSARNMRTRLEPALVKEFASGDDLAYRRLLFLDETLKGMIYRFEDEYPECRVSPPSPQQPASPTYSFDSIGSPPPAEDMTSSVATLATETSGLSLDSDLEDDDPVRSSGTLRRSSDVSLANRALALEEGRIHRLGSKVRQDLVTHHQQQASTSSVSYAPPFSPSSSSPPTSTAEWAPGSHMAGVAQKMGDMSGPELKTVVDTAGWEGVMLKLGANMEELRQLQMKDPVGWAQFKESQLIARANVGAREESAVE